MRGFEWTRRRVALTGAAALGMMVMACETPAPSAVEVDLPAGERIHGDNKITGTLRGVVGAGWGILSKLYALREESCKPPSSS